MSNSAIGLAMSKIYHRIPRQLLKAAFDSVGQLKSMDACIMEDVIRAYVIPKLIRSIGLPTIIPIRGEWRVPHNQFSAVTDYGTLDAEWLHIPSEWRMGRNILEVFVVSSALNVAVSDIPIGFPGYGTGNSIVDYARFAAASYTHAGVQFQPVATLRDNNIVQLTVRGVIDGYSLQCLLEYDEEFTNMPVNMHEPLADYILAMTKAHIHNKLYIDTGAAKIVGGMALDEFNQVLADYKIEDQVLSDLHQRVVGSQALTPEQFRMLLPSLLPV